MALRGRIRFWLKLSSVIDGFIGCRSASCARIAAVQSFRAFVKFPRDLQEIITQQGASDRLGGISKELSAVAKLLCA